MKCVTKTGNLFEEKYESPMKNLCTDFWSFKESSCKTESSPSSTTMPFVFACFCLVLGTLNDSIDLVFLL